MCPSAAMHRLCTPMLAPRSRNTVRLVDQMDSFLCASSAVASNSVVSGSHNLDLCSDPEMKASMRGSCVQSVRC